MADLPERVQAALASRYRLERALGHGAMARVFLAYDRKQQRRVALKVLTPELALAVRVQRFHREIEYAKTLTHPGIVPLLESDTAAGVPYYTMPFVEGSSLQERLARDGPLPLDEAVQIVREVADALAYAHRRGIIHRDIKPANILLVEGHAVVADFGIARAVHESEEATITATGVALGTPAYMSPEQTTGAVVDARSDIYSLGCVAYEMLEGRPPFDGPTADAVRARHRDDPVPPFRRPDLPLPLTTAIGKALAKHPGDRFATAAEFVAALTRPAGASAVAASWRRFRPSRRAATILAALAGVGLLAAAPQRWWAGDLADPAPSVAVLPFVNMSGDTANDYLGDGITEEVISTLGQVEGMRVPARTSSFAFKKTTTDIREIGRTLNVAHVLEASIRSGGDSIRITARLIKVADGYPVWTGTFDRQRSGALALQKDIAWAIVRALEVRLRGTEAALARRNTDNPEAYDLYLRGRYFWNRRTAADIRKAIDYFGRAIAHDSGYALAYSGLADAYVLAGQYRYIPREFAFDQAKQAALRAVVLNESLAEAHTSLGKVYQNRDWDWEGAERAYRRAIALNPRYALAHTWYAMLLGRGLARHDEAIRQALAGHELDPLSPWANNNVSVVLNHARRHDEAIRYARRAIELAPDWNTAHGQLAQSYRWKGMFAEALAEYDSAARLGSRNRDHHAAALIYAQSGRREEAIAALRVLEAHVPRSEVWVELAALYTALGDFDRALVALDSAIAAHAFPGEPTLASSPDWDPLRSDPRFAALLRRIGLQP